MTPKAPLYLALPVGRTFGWGICGRHITEELASIDDVVLLASPAEIARLQDPVVESRFERWLPNADVRALIDERVPTVLNGPVLQGIPGVEFAPAIPGVSGTFNAGYTFFEDNLLAERNARELDKHFDLVIAGSTYNEDVLRRAGVSRVATVLQGVLPSRFNPDAHPRTLLQDSFVIFSGGKFELRKGQDIVLQAVRVLQERYDDVMLVTAWHNPWVSSAETMREVSEIQFSGWEEDSVAAARQVVEDNRLDSDRVVCLAELPNEALPHLYKNTDVGLFPNRCEGGTNLVLMEYMACGKAVVATASTGHADVVHERHARRIETLGERVIPGVRGPRAAWPEPSLESAIAQLDWAYHHRAELAALGAAAGEFMKQWTWAATAKRFQTLLRQT